VNSIGVAGSGFRVLQSYIETSETGFFNVLRWLRWHAVQWADQVSNL